MRRRSPSPQPTPPPSSPHTPRTPRPTLPVEIPVQFINDNNEIQNKEIPPTYDYLWDT